MRSLLDTTLMRRVGQGDESAFAELYRRYNRKLLDFFFAMGRDPHLAEELAGDTFARVWQVRRRYAATGSFPAYLFSFARHIWLEHCRRARKHWKLGVVADWADVETTLVALDAFRPDEAASGAELERHIAEALNELPEEQRMVFVMRVVERMPSDPDGSFSEEDDDALPLTSYLDEPDSVRQSYDYFGAYTKVPITLPPAEKALPKWPIMWDAVLPTNRGVYGLDSSAGWQRGPSLEFNHVPGGGNVLWLDGSVEFVHLTQWAETNLPARPLGIEFIAPMKTAFGAPKEAESLAPPESPGMRKLRIESTINRGLQQLQKKRK